MARGNRGSLPLQRQLAAARQFQRHKSHWNVKKLCTPFPYSVTKFIRTVPVSFFFPPYFLSFLPFFAPPLSYFLASSISPGYLRQSVTHFSFHSFICFLLLFQFLSCNLTDFRKFLL